MELRTLSALGARALFVLIFSMQAVSAFSQSSREQLPDPTAVTIPLKGGGLFGSSLNMHAEVFKPSGEGPFPVMIYAHGRSGTQQERNALRDVIPRQYLQFWIARGFAAVGVARPGYGRTGGADREYPGHTWEGPGRCGGSLDPKKVAEAAGAALISAIDWTRQQRWAKPNALLLSGNSVGGMTAAFVGAQSPEGVVAYINFAGGVGGNPTLSPGQSCAPERVQGFLGSLGKDTTLPNLWIYAENDLFWGSQAPRAWHSVFAASSKGPTSFVMTNPITAPDGHDLIFVGREQWLPQVDDFLKRLGL